MARGATAVKRRTFLQATSAALAGLALAGCSPSHNSLEKGSELAEGFETKGKWVPAACWLNCGGRCYNAAYVEDGVVKYQKTDDLEEDSVERPQVRGCLRGRSLRHVVYAPDRIRYPMKRKSWTPENPNGELRGKDEWERISWDEAYDYVATALKNAIEKDGNRSIVMPGWPYAGYEHLNAIYGMGGATTINDTSSYGCYNRTCSVTGAEATGGGLDRIAMQECDYAVLHACNPSWATPGMSSWFLKQAKDAGVQFVYVGPSYNESADLLDARWIRVRPGTDTAFLLSVAYEMIKLDEDQGGILDKDFLDRCTVGFDSDHMPDDAVLDENFKDYVLGAYDDTPKTAEWATEICGTPVEDIRWFAQMMGAKNKVAWVHSMAAARCNDADDIPQLFMTIGAMGGHMGKAGHCTGGAFQLTAGNGGSSLVMGGATGESAPFAMSNPVSDCIDAPDLWNAILTGTYHYNNSAMIDASTAEQRDIKIHVIYNIWRNTLQTIQGIATGIEAFRSVDCVITQDYNFNNTAKYSDILLPVTTQWERQSSYFYLSSTGREYMLAPSKVIEPLWEAKSDREVCTEIAKRMGVDTDPLFNGSLEQQYFNVIAGATVINEAGDGYEPLVTITQEDLDELGFEGNVQKGRITYKELMEKGIYKVPRKKGDNYGPVPYQAFREDPEGNPRSSVSGKLEIYCQKKADGVNAMGRSTIKPYPSYRAALHGYEESFSDWGNKVKGEYPYQMYNPHYLRRAHTGFDNVPQLREAMANPVFLNAQDAAAKGIVQGDTVRIFNSYGSCLRNAITTERLMPGCVALPHGTWCDLTEDESMDKSGSDNWMLAPDTSGQGVSGYNTNLVNYEKWTGEVLAADSTRVFAAAGGIE